MKSTRDLLLILLLIFSPGVSFAQNHFSCGVSGGVNSSGTGGKSLYIRDEYFPGLPADSTIASGRPLLGPAAACWAKYNFNKRFYTRLALLYTFSGEKSYVLDIIHHVPGSSKHYTLDDRINSTFHKISAPLVVGYNFRIRAVKASIFIGYAQQFYLTGNIKHTHTSVIGTISDMWQYEGNPFNKSDFGLTAKRWNPSAALGINSTLSKKLAIEFCWTINKEIVSAITPDDDIGYFYLEDDLSLMLQFLIK